MLVARSLWREWGLESVLDGLAPKKTVCKKRRASLADRLLVTIQNLALLRQRGQGYLVGLKRQRNQQVNGYIQAAAQGPWQECPAGINAQEK
jgi:hypothetical protein